MGMATTDRQFTATNLDPALAEAVEAAPPGQILEGIARLEDPGQVPPGFRVVSRFHRICTGRFAADQAWTIRRHPNVISLKATRALGRHDDDDHESDRLGVRPGIRSAIRSGPRPAGERLPFTGRGCIVAALDFGLDFAHPNFLRPDGTTRLLSFWHQGAAYDPARPNRFGYGRDFSRQEINAALAAADPYQALGYHPRHSDSGKGSHGTHTLDIAAGNGRARGARAGAAPDADLIFVHLSTPRLDTAGDLGDSVRLLEALDYVDTAAGGRPWVVNLSVGRTAGSHDGTSPVEQGMHELLRRGPGRAIVQSAGNYRSASLAAHGRLQDGAHRDLTWMIDPADTTANEIDAWYSGKDRFVVAIRPPQAAAFLPVRLGEVAAIVHQGSVVGRIYHRKSDPNNGDNHVEAFLYPSAPAGAWTLRLGGDYVINGRYHAWIERDLARRGAQSRFDAGVSSPAYTLGTIATSPLVITVGAYDGHAEGAPLAPFSSCGPTRDERYDKPELLAPGVDVLAARSIPRGATRQEGLLVERSGTSMAAPHVAGTVAAMFEAAGRPVTIDVIRACLKQSARPHGAPDQAGCCAWGQLDSHAAIREIQAKEIQAKEIQAREIRAGRRPEPALESLVNSQAAVPWIDAAEIASADEVTDEVTEGAANEFTIIDAGTEASDEAGGDEAGNDEEAADVELLDRPAGTAQAFSSDEPDRAEDEAAGTKAAVGVLVVDEQGRPLVDGRYTAWQGTTREAGSFTATGRGIASLKSIDPAKPFVFEVGDRVCAIRGGAFIDPDDKALEYGGTWFDWTLVRDDDQPDTKFWPHYRREMDLAAGIDEAKTATGRRVDRFLQHEHVNRRPLQLTRAVRGGQGNLQIVASPTRLRAGPLLRYTDHQQAVVWLETVTPAMVRVRCVRASDGSPSMHWASTVRVGGRYFAAVEVTGLQQQTTYKYTVDLAPLPGDGAVPATPEAVAKAFPTLSSPVGEAMTRQLKPISLDGTGWLVFRTLRPRYEDRLRFATGSCRWYPGDLKNGKDWGPDMLVGLGKWLAVHRNDREKWPDFLFFGGDQIYADEIGDDHGAMLVRGRFAARIPGPVDPAPTAQGKLVDGAWAGRFAHRYKTYKDPEKTLVDRVRTDFRKLDELDRRYPEIRDYLRYAAPALTEKEQRELSQRLMMALVRALGGKITDQKTYDRARELVRTAETLNMQSGSYRAFLPHWDAGLDPAMRHNPMLRRYLVHNFLLWELPTFEAQLPRVIDSSNLPLVQPSKHGHVSPAEARHASDFAEYAYLYERAWAGCPEVRPLLAHIPTFLMLDDHEATDDWNCSLPWARMLHNKNDALRLWPKTLTDGLAAYWMYQGWCNKAPSQWPKEDPRIRALDQAHRAGRDALPGLRRCIHDACFRQEPSKATFQTGLGLDWHYKLPFDPPFLVPDCRTRRFMVESDEDLRVIDHDSPRRPASQTIDAAQLDWMRKILVTRGGPSVAFIAPSTPLLLQRKVMEIMTRPETTAEAWDTARHAALGLPELPSLIAATAGSTLLGAATNALLRIFKRARDLEHMIRDKSWRDLWDMADSMRQAGSGVKTLVVVSGDVHHSYCMTGNLSAGGRPTPELLQITCSGLQTTIRSSVKESLAKKLGDRSFNVGKRRLVPGFMFKNRTGDPDLALFQNAVAFVEVSMGAEVDVRVRYLSGADEHVFRYTSGAAYMRNGEPSLSPWQNSGSRLNFQDITRGAEDTESHFDPGDLVGGIERHSGKADAMNSITDLAERVLQSTTGGRRESEVSFLQGLLGDIGAGASAAAMSPARLYRILLGGGPASEDIRNALEIVARPSERPNGALRPGDWMLRVVPGVGDIGHVTVLISEDLQEPSAIAADGIDAESAQDGQYGVVVEAGAFPHNRSRPFARRWLDGRGRVPPHSLILRPRRRQTPPTIHPSALNPPTLEPPTLEPPLLDPPAPEPPDVDPPHVGSLEGGSPDGGRDQDRAEEADTFTPPAWLKVGRRSHGRAPVRPPASDGEAAQGVDAMDGWIADDAFVAPPWLRLERRGRSPSQSGDFATDGEAFTFDPTGAQTDFGPQLRKAWHAMLKAAFKINLDDATSQIGTLLGISHMDAAKHVRFFSPASRPPSMKLAAANVAWRAFPTSSGPASPSTYKFFDELQTDPASGRLLRAQDEYCEWKVFHNGTGRIVRVVFTSEPPEYYQFLYDPGVASLTKFARALLVKLYKERCGGKAVTLADLETTVAGVKQYDPGNKWNNDHCVHLQQPNNTLGAQINIAARGAIVRRDSSGNLVTSVKTLIGCDPFGEPSRQSDPNIGDNVNKLARENRFLTLQNPVGLYMVTLDTSGWTTPDGTDAQKYWKVIKGKPDKDPRKSMIVRAEYAVPASKGYTVSDIKIGGAPIDFGSQIAEQLEMRLGALFGPKDKDPEGRATTAPLPVLC